MLFAGQYPFALKEKIIPGSDGAGEVIAVGSKVTRFQVGAKVVTLFNQTHLGGSLDLQTTRSGLGGAIDGTLRQYGTFNENGLVDMPPSLNWAEASTLSCAALTAWNTLYGLKPLIPGDVVLTQGTGGVSIFAVQFAKAAGATVSKSSFDPVFAMYF
jgi:NADPH:quinone reductase-like Zn-dependent oxidoreductase